MFGKSFNMTDCEPMDLGNNRSLDEMIQDLSTEDPAADPGAKDKLIALRVKGFDKDRYDNLQIQTHGKFTHVLRQAILQLMTRTEESLELKSQRP